VPVKYLLLIYDDESTFEAIPPEQRAAVYKEYGDLADDLGASGVMLSGEELGPTSSATTVRIRSGDQMVTDGPFAETKEQLGGYFAVDVEDLDAAIAIAARIPGVRTGSIEIRPLVDGP
jgi:hypothetical protein